MKDVMAARSSTRILRSSPFDDATARSSASRFGWRLFIASLAVLFLSMWIGFVIIRVENADTWPTDLPGLPGVLWISTLVLLTSSVTMHRALIATRRHRPRQTYRLLAATLALGLIFILLQVMAWLSWQGDIGMLWYGNQQERFALAALYVLTALHALHVIGGVLPLGWMTVRSHTGVFSGKNHSPVEAMAGYWHFLDAVWLIILVTLLIGL